VSRHDLDHESLPWKVTAATASIVVSGTLVAAPVAQGLWNATGRPAVSRWDQATLPPQQPEPLAQLAGTPYYGPALAAATAVAGTAVGLTPSGPPYRLG
jgi:hypothetical protein